MDAIVNFISNHALETIAAVTICCIVIFMAADRLIEHANKKKISGIKYSRSLEKKMRDIRRIQDGDE